MSLEEYRTKRDFAKTKEPEGIDSAETGNRFVIQEHHARNLHWDFRLEIGGVLKSWALPKGIPMSEGKRNLAVQTEDHPLEYISFAGEIPEGEYGAGTVTIWDSGSYSIKDSTPEKYEVVLEGKVVKGKYVLIRFKKAGDKEWLIFKTR